MPAANRTETGSSEGAEAGREPLITGGFLAVMAVTALFFVSVGIQVPLVPRLIEERLGGAEFDIGLNLAVFSIAAIAIRPWLGSWGDRHGRRALMIAGPLLATFASVLASTVDDRWWLLPPRAITGIGEAALFVGAATAINDLAPAHRRAEAASYFSLAVFGGIGAGPIIGEMLIDRGGWALGFLVAAAFTLAATGAALLVAPDRPVLVDAGPVVERGPDVAAVAGPDAVPEAGPHAGPDAASDGAGRRSYLHPAALRPGAVLALAIAGFATFNAFVPEHSTAVGLSGSKWVFALYGLVCLVLRLGAARLPERLGLGFTVTGALGALALGLAVLGSVATPTGLYAGTVIVGLGMSFLYPALSTMAVNAAPATERSLAVATFTMFFEIGSVIGGLLLGFVAELTGKRGGFIGGAVSCLVALVVLRLVTLPAVRTWPIPAGEVDVATAH